MFHDDEALALLALRSVFKQQQGSMCASTLSMRLPEYQFTGMTVLKLVLMSFTLGLFVGVMLTVLAEMLLR